MRTKIRRTLKMIKLGNAIDDIRTRYDEITWLIGDIEKNLPLYPAGRIRIQNKNNQIYYHHVEDNSDRNGIILSDKDKGLISNLIKKSYLEKVLKVARQEQLVLKKMLDDYPINTIEGVYSLLPQERQAMFKPVIPTDEMFLNDWINMPYTPKGFKEGTPFYTTQKGERVRSKSEQIIADRLFAAGIPYKYECPLRLKNGIVHPDFTILRMSDRQEIYYEHLGKIGDKEYADDNVPKINRYVLSGIDLGKRLFLTMESGGAPFDVRVLDRMIEEDFR